MNKKTAFIGGSAVFVGALVIGVAIGSNKQTQQSTVPIYIPASTPSSASTYSSSGSSSYSSQKSSAVDALTISGVSTRKTGTLTYVKGSIKNTSSQDFDVILNMAMFDSSGGLITVKPISIKLSANGTMYFDELVGNNAPSASSVQLQN